MVEHEVRRPSWWVGTTRQEFARRLAEQQPRLTRLGTKGWVDFAGTIERRRDRGLRDGDAWDEPEG